MKHIEKLSYKYINTYGRFSQHRKSEEPIIDKINEIIDILQNKGLCKIKDKNSSQLLEIAKLSEENDRLTENIHTAIKDIFTLIRVLDANVKELKCTDEELKVINKYSYNSKGVKND